MGMMLGLVGGGSALVFGIWLGAFVSLLIIACGRLSRSLSRFAGAKGRFTMKSEIPFGPFLVAGTLFVYFTHVTLLNLVGMM
jgi:prepilin signal peptidase PulO-like enzyme (type II secretory pathway)